MCENSSQEYFEENSRLLPNVDNNGRNGIINERTLGTVSEFDFLGPTNF